ncbi:MAG: HVA22/TB2/DP1 family protein, partial [Flammeovirgaceae bacterium]
ITSEKKDESVLFHKYKEQIKILHDKTGFNGQYIIIGFISCGLIVFLGIFDSFITNIVGTLFPAYLSMRSIETFETDIEKQWITYWVLFSLFNLLDKLSVIFIFYLPFYYFIKYIFLVWLFLPNFNGASILYDTFSSNHLKKVETIIDKNIIKKRMSDSLIEPISTETSKVNEKVMLQPTTPVKVNTETTSTSDKK